jgi:tetratricopeptide (TPR) repeat protein
VLPASDLPALRPEVQALIKRARAKEEDGEYFQARTLWHSVLQQDRGNLDALHGVARTFVAEKRDQDAQRAYEAALRVHPDATDLRFELAELHRRAGRADQALLHLDKILTQTRDNASVLALRGSLLLGQERYTEAARDLERALAKQDDLRDARLNLASAYLNQGLDERAIGIYQQILLKHPDDIDARYSLGVALQKIERYDKALEQWAQVLEQRPDHDPARQSTKRLQSWLKEQR